MSFNHFTPVPPSDQLIGHRGIAALAPENTMASFRLAATQKVSWIEFDVRLTKDHELVIFHDDMLDRTTNGTGYVYEHNLIDLRTLDAGSWFAPRYKDEKIPVFEEVFTQLLELGLKCNIEMKFPSYPTRNHIDVLAQKLLAIIEHKWPKSHPLPLISSFEWDALAYVRRHMPQVPIGFLTEQCSPMLIEEVAKTKNAALHCEYLSLTTELLTIAHNFNVPILAYTVNEPSIANQLFNQRVFGLFSDNPRHLRC
ncbi:MAG: glycerophosphodiester phosphodiesterase family protein [Candidatus Berkiella sp.]